MKKTNRQLVLGSLQPLLFCVGMYCVVLIFSVFICTSIYRALHPKKYALETRQVEKGQKTLPTTAMVSAFK